jgi:hypothetical protein
VTAAISKTMAAGRMHFIFRFLARHNSHSGVQYPTGGSKSSPLRALVA